jgi:hypothetical protein
MKEEELPSAHTAVDGLDREPELDELRPRDDASLRGRERRDGRSGRDRRSGGELTSHCDV